MRRCLEHHTEEPFITKTEQTANYADLILALHNPKITITYIDGNFHTIEVHTTIGSTFTTRV